MGAVGPFGTVFMLWPDLCAHVQSLVGLRAPACERRATCVMQTLCGDLVGRIVRQIE